MASERASLGYQLERLRKLGWNLPAAVDFIERRGKAPPSISLGVVAAEFLSAKKAAGLRLRYLRTLRASINRFLINRREKIISEISAAEILEYISRNGWAASTMRSYLVDVRTLFAFAVKRKYLPENPALAVDLPRSDENPFYYGVFAHKAEIHQGVHVPMITKRRLTKFRRRL